MDAVKIQAEIDWIIEFADSQPDKRSNLTDKDPGRMIRSTFFLFRTDNPREHFEKIFDSGVKLEHILSHFRRLKCTMDFSLAVLLLELNNDSFDLKELVSLAFPRSSDEYPKDLSLYTKFIEQYGIDLQLCLDVYMLCISQVDNNLKEPYLEYLLTQGATLTQEQCFDLYVQDNVLCFSTDKVSQLIYSQIDFAHENFNKDLIDCWSRILGSEGNVLAHEYYRRDAQHILNFMTLFEQYLMNSECLDKFVNTDFMIFDGDERTTFNICGQKFIEYGVQIDPKFKFENYDALGYNMTPEIFMQCGFTSYMSDSDWFALFFVSANNLMIESEIFCSDAIILQAMMQKSNSFKFGIMIAHWAKYLGANPSLLSKIKHYVDLYVEANLSEEIVQIILSLDAYACGPVKNEYFHELLDYCLTLGLDLNVKTFRDISLSTKSYLESREIVYGEKLQT
jgi:hypothetical protein